MVYLFLAGLVNFFAWSFIWTCICKYIQIQFLKRHIQKCKNYVEAINNRQLGRSFERMDVGMEMLNFMEEFVALHRYGVERLENSDPMLDPDGYPEKALSVHNMEVQYQILKSMYNHVMGETHANIRVQLQS